MKTTAAEQPKGTTTVQTPPGMQLPKVRMSAECTMAPAPEAKR